MNLILLGGPGAGKGTQAKRILDITGVAHISTGDMLRSAVAKGTKLGMEAKVLMDTGALVSDAIVIGLVDERLNEKDCENGYMLDGFPRTLAQGEALDIMLKEKKKPIDHVVLFEVDDEELVQRITGRRTCGDCGAIYHLLFSPPPSPGVCKCGSKNLVLRDDDNETTVRKRLAAFHSQTTPLVEFYEKKQLLRRIIGTGKNSEEVFTGTRKLLGF